MAEGVVEVMRAGPEAWVWRYRGPDGAVLLANRTFSSHHEAVRSAARAYPGARMEDPLRTRLAARVPLRKLAMLGLAATAAAVVVGRWRTRRSIRVRRVAAG